VSYRDDVDALYLRAQALEREVARLEDELARTRGPRAPQPVAAPPRSPPPPRAPDHRRDGGRTRAGDAADVRPPPPRPRDDPDRFPDPGEVAAQLRRLRDRTVWLPPGLEAGQAGAGRDDEAVGVLVARLTIGEHWLVTRLLELLTDDDFSAEGVARNQAIFDDLVDQLRARLGGH
jgi:hypothetical protein